MANRKPNPYDPEVQELLPDNSSAFEDQPFIDNNALEEAAMQGVINDYDAKQTANKNARELAAEFRERRNSLMTPEDKIRAEQQEERRLARSQNFKVDKPEPKKDSGYKPIYGKVNVSAKGTTVANVQRILNSLNINLEVQFTRTDTMNLLATLLTCNEHQLQALYNNNKVPVVIKTVIKRLLDDSKVGSMEAIEKIWDRIFGKAGMLVDLPQGSNAMPGVIPNQPVSREAYIVIRETVFGGDK